MTKKQNFLREHNKLAPLKLQATLAMLSVFKKEKGYLFKNTDWSIDKLRRPFILWLTFLTKESKREIKQKEQA